MTTVLILTGCWDSMELNKMTIISGIAIDKGNNGEILLSTMIVHFYLNNFTVEYKNRFLGYF
jgi:hypothetical protein